MAGRRVDEGGPDARGEHRAAVADRRVHDGGLQRRDRDVALPDGEVRRVAGTQQVAAAAVLDGDLLEVGGLLPVVDVGVAGARPPARLAPGRLPGGLLPRAVGDAAARLPGQVDAGARAEPEPRGGGDERVARVVGGGEPALGAPRVVGERVEHGVARDLEGHPEADQPPPGGLVVVEDPVADAVLRRAVVGAVQRVAGPHRGDHRRRLDRARRRELDADRPGQQRRVRGCRRQPGVVGLRDAPGPDVRVVCRRAGQGGHRTRARVEHHDGARVRRPAAVTGGGHLRREGLLGGRLHAHVERGDQVATGDRLGPRDHPGDQPSRVDRDHGAPGHPAQHRVVLLLQSRAPHEVVGHEPTVAADLVGAHLAQVAQHLGGRDALRPGVEPHRPRLDGHAGEAVGLLDEREGAGRVDALGERHRDLRRAGPAGRSRRGARLATQPGAAEQAVGRDAQHRGDLAHHRGAPVVAVGEHPALDGHHRAGPVVGEHLPVRVEDAPTQRGNDEGAGVERGRHRPEVVVPDELHLPQPPHQGGEAQPDEQHHREEAPLVGAGPAVSCAGPEPRPPRTCRVIAVTSPT